MPSGQTASAALVILGILVGAGLVLTSLYASGVFAPRITTETITTTSAITTTSLPRFTQVSVNATNISRSLPMFGLSATCSTSPSGSTYLSVQNTGTINATARDLTIVPSGEPSATTGLLGTECVIPAGRALFVIITSLANNWGTLSAGEPYTGYLTLLDGTLIRFTGAFS